MVSMNLFPSPQAIGLLIAVAILYFLYRSL